MQIENHKEEVPFGHYVGLFQQADAMEIAERTGVKWDGKEFYVNLLGTTYAISHPEYAIRECPTSVSCADNPFAVPGVRLADGAAALPTDRGTRLCSAPSATGSAEQRGPSREEVQIPSPLERGDRKAVGVVNAALPTLPVQTFLLRYLLEGKAVCFKGGWKTFREMPWGELYIQPYTGRVLTRAAFTFGTRIDAFKAACEKMGAKPLKHGDAGYEFAFLGDYAMRIMVWAGDDEFPPNAQVLYSDNFETGFAPEDRVVAGDILISAIKSRM